MTNIVVPELGESVVEARVAKWLKNEGDRVEVGEPVVELETEKIDLEVGAEHGGVLASIKRQQGEDVKVGELLAVVDDGAAAQQAPPAAASARTGAGGRGNGSGGTEPAGPAAPPPPPPPPGDPAGGGAFPAPRATPPPRPDAPGHHRALCSRSRRR